MTPVEMEVMLHCYYVADPHIRFATGDVSPAYRAAVKKLQSNRCIDEDLHSTDLGNAYVEMLKMTPLPVERRRWMDPRTDDVIIEK